MAKMFNFSKSQFSYVKNGENNNFLGELSQNQRNVAHRRCSISSIIIVLIFQEYNV